MGAGATAAAGGSDDEMDTPSSRASLRSRRCSSSPVLKSKSMGSHLTAGPAASCALRCGS